MKKKNLIAVLLILVYAFGLFGCSNNEVRVWEWAQSLAQEDIVSAIPWHCDTEHTESEPLNEEEIRELAALLNGLTKKNFTENKHLVGITATVGINLETDSETYHINYAPSPYGKYGMLEMKYGEKQWWIDDTALLAFFERVTDSRPTEAIREDELYVSPEDLDVFYDLESFLDYAATAPSGGIADLASLEYFYLPTGIPEEYRLYKITAAKNDIGFWYLPEEALASDDTRLSAESRNEHFLFISPRVNYSGFAGDETILTWQENGDSLMLYLPKDFTVDDREAFCQTEKFCRNSEGRFLKEVTYADAPPAEYFISVEEAVKEIIAVKEAGAEKMSHPGDFRLYEKDYLYFLKEAPPLPGYTQEAVVLILEGTEITYRNSENNGLAIFYWQEGYENDENIENLIERFNLKQHKDTKFFFGKKFDDLFIFWWEDGDEFSFSYPADSKVHPEEIIEYLEVEKYVLD